MVNLKTENLELRGIVNKTSSKGNVYQVIYVENKNGQPFNFYVPDASALPQGLKKGDSVVITFTLSYYKGNERLNVSKVERSNNA